MAHVEFPLTQGKFALVCADDLPLLAGRKWHAKKCGQGKFYAATGAGSDAIYMHRLITGIHGQPRGTVVDHINHNTLDNRRENLKVCSHAENMRNRSDRKAFLGGSPWVWKQGNGWAARIQHQNTVVYLGFYQTEREAGIAYAAAEKVILAAFGRLS